MNPAREMFASARLLEAIGQGRFVSLQESVAAFYRDFHASKEETNGHFVYDLGNGLWDIPQLRTLLPQVLSNSHPIEDFEVEHAFPTLGQRTMLLNARRFPPESNEPELVLLAIEDVTARRRADHPRESIGVEINQRDRAGAYQLADGLEAVTLITQQPRCLSQYRPAGKERRPQQLEGCNASLVGFFFRSRTIATRALVSATAGSTTAENFHVRRVSGKIDGRTGLTLDAADHSSGGHHVKRREWFELGRLPRLGERGGTGLLKLG